MIAVTLTGQLTLLMLIERAEEARIPVVSGNTDGVLFHCPREHYEGIGDGDRLSGNTLLREICEEWERDTGFDLEFAEYDAIYNQSVNSYFAFKPNGEIKQKGSIADYWFCDQPDLREMMMHNPSMTVVTNAALEMIKNGTPIEETLRACTDPRQFVTIVTVNGGATWRGDYLGKVVRYYWSTDGDPIYRAKATAKGTHNKVSLTDGCRPMMELVEDLPTDIDYDRYARATSNLLRDVGYFSSPLAPPRRTIRKWRPENLIAWALAS
jgi:hypothetical protein